MTTQYTFEAIGTSWKIDIEQQLSPEKSKQIFTEIQTRINAFDQAYSRFRPDSLVSQMSRQSGEYALTEDAGPLFSLYHELYQLTNGSFTPLIGQVLVDAGYDAQYSLTQRAELHSPDQWDQVISYKPEIGKVLLKKPALLDFGAAGKGYLVDLVGEVLRHHHLDSFCIDAGGDILTCSSSTKCLRVGLENPNKTSDVIGVANLTNQSICGSAGNRRKWREFHHIIHPQTLSSPRNLLATWVIANTTILADALSTCLFFVPAKVLRERYNFEYLVLNADYSVEGSDSFPAELYA